MNHSIQGCISALLLAGAIVLPASANTIFTIADPPVDFEVIDAEPYDGIGDNGPYATFNDAVVGTIGEARSMAEFDLSSIGLPPGEAVASAVFEIRITDVDISGLGVNGETPQSLEVDGYVGDGVAELSDFQAGDGNLLDQVATPEPYVGQIVSFDVTAFIADLAGAGEPFAGLTLRAGSFGGLMAEEGNGFPKLTIETTPSTAAGMVDPSGPLLVRAGPNPFTVSTRIEYRLPAGDGGPVVLTIHDATGRLVRVLQDPDRAVGVHGLVWDGRDQDGLSVPAGIYYCRLRWNDTLGTGRVVLIR